MLPIDTGERGEKTQGVGVAHGSATDLCLKSGLRDVAKDGV